jgi:hypothetical protein
MLIKNFITSEQQTELLAWSNNLPQTNEPNFVSFELIPDAPLCLDDIRNKCVNSSTNVAYLKSITADFILEVPVNSEITNHTDGKAIWTFDKVLGNYDHIRFIILLQKPTDGGELIVNNETVLMDELDCFVLNSSALIHALSKVNGLKNYMAIAFLFECEI